MILSHSPAEVIQKYLLDQGVGALFSDAADWSVYRDTMPSLEPDQLIVVNDTTPVLDGKDMKSKETIQHPGIMVRVRSLDSDDGKYKGVEIEAALDAIEATQVEIDGYFYLIQAFNITSGLTFVGQEERNNRFLFSINGTLTIKEL